MRIPSPLSVPSLPVSPVPLPGHAGQHRHAGHSHAQFGPFSRRSFLASAAALTAGTALGWPQSLAAAGSSDPVPIPNGSPHLVPFRVFAPAALDGADAEPITITDFNGSVGLAYISGMVTQTNTATGDIRRLPFVDADMRFMSGVYRGMDGRVHQGSFGFI